MGKNICMSCWLSCFLSLLMLIGLQLKFVFMEWQNDDIHMKLKYYIIVM